MCWRQDDSKHGEGKFTSSKNETYEGQWRLDIRHGEGRWVGLDGRYDGQWKDDKKHGEGELHGKKVIIAHGRLET